MSFAQGFNNISNWQIGSDICMWMKQLFNIYCGKNLHLYIANVTMEGDIVRLGRFVDSPPLQPLLSGRLWGMVMSREAQADWTGKPRALRTSGNRKAQKNTETSLNHTKSIQDLKKLAYDPWRLWLSLLTTSEPRLFQKALKHLFAEELCPEAHEQGRLAWLLYWWPDGHLAGLGGVFPLKTHGDSWRSWRFCFFF